MRYAAAILVLFHVTSVFAMAPDEVRGTWLTTTANDALATPAKTAETMKRLREIGLNTVYVECWKNGYTEFPSDTLQKTIKITHKINLPKPPVPELSPDAGSGHHATTQTSGWSESRDLLGEAVIEAHRNQLLCIAWFEYGFMVAHKDTQNELRKTKPQWLLRDAAGNEVAPDGMVWMNPIHPEVRAFLTNIVLDAINFHDLDGIQLDDRLAWPANTFGYDEFTQAAYAKDHGSPPPSDPDNAEWVRWRAEKVTEFAKEFTTMLKKSRPDLLLSVSPSPYPWSAEHHAAEWPTWMRNGWFGEYVPQMYRDNYARFASEWPGQIEQAAERKGDLVAGLRIVGEGKDTPWDDLRKMVELTRQSGAGGHAWWFSRGVLDVYPKEIAEFYDVANQGYAKHPKRPADWRPAPLVADRRRDHWYAHIEKPGAYHIIAKRKDGIWFELRTAHLGTGTMDISDQKYDAVELLIDRQTRR